MSVLLIPFRRPVVIVFACWTWALFWLLDGKRFSLFLLPDLFPLILISAFLMLLFFCLSLTKEMSSRPSSRELFSSWILLLPLLFLVPVKDKTLGIYAYTKKSFTNLGSVQRQKQTRNTPNTVKPKKEPTLMELTENWPAYIGHEITTLGQLSFEQKEIKNFGFLFRFAVACCTADAIPLGILIETQDKTEMASGSPWVRVTGTLAIRNIAGNDRLVLQNTSLERKSAPPPQERYLYISPDL